MMSKLGTLRSLALATICFFVVALFLLSPGAALAAGCDDATSFLGGFGCITGEGADPTKGASLRFLIIRVIQVGLVLVGAIALAAIVWGGIMYILALGDEARASRAKKILLFAIIGLIIVLAAGLIVNVVVGAFSASP